MMDDSRNGRRDIDKVLLDHLNQDQARLDRIENKIDKLADTVVAIARAEEKLVSLEVAKKEIGKRLDEHDARLDRHSDAIMRGTGTIQGITKFLWIIAAAGVAALLNLYIR